MLLALEKAARVTLALSTWSVFRTITLPLVRPGARRGDSDHRDLHPRRFRQSLVDRRRFTALPSQVYSLIEGFGYFHGRGSRQHDLLVLPPVRCREIAGSQGTVPDVTISGKATSIPRPPVPSRADLSCVLLCVWILMILIFYGLWCPSLCSVWTVLFPNNLGFTLNHFDTWVRIRNR